MLSKKMQGALNKQINAETYSAYLYLSMAAHAKSLGLDGFENWFRAQVQEELVHAMKFFDYVNERGGRVTLTAIDAPPAAWKSPLAVFEATLKHEQHVTSLINKLVDLAVAESDHATANMLQWFVAEQVEEEATADGIRQKLALVGDRGNALYMIDRELATRVFTPPAAAQE
ncbi:MAG: ferritin [Candidatus Eisenbacteria bacterium]|nr:ferritin [Candidatus Eisenbacteria bacterium]